MTDETTQLDAESDEHEAASVIYAEAPSGRYWIGGQTRGLPAYVKADDVDALRKALAEALVKAPHRIRP